MHRMPSDLRVAAYDEVRLVALTTQDEDRAAEFVARTLGELAIAGPELRETLRVYVREGMSASRAARALFTHRNTVLNRVARARSSCRSRWRATAWTSASRWRSCAGLDRDPARSRAR
jgi:DNA-binding PucR family transcriptional regulator